MKYLKIKNKGKLDIRLIALMGGTTKESDKFKIGNFGTGLKYTLAYLFRNNIDFKIMINGEEVKITTETEQIGDELFEIICINGHRTSITTKMGREWEAWMIIRELYANALDEGEAEHSIETEITGNVHETCFYIQLTPDVKKVYDNWQDYFIVGKEPMYENSQVAIHAGMGTMKIYKQGILIKEYKDEKSLFSYDLKDAQINELRQYQGLREGDLYYAIMSIDCEKTVEYFIENVNDDLYESEIDYDYDWRIGQFNDVWEKVIGAAKIIHKKAKDRLEARGIEIDEAKNIVVPEKLYKGLVKQFDGIGALRVAKDLNDFFEIYDDKLHDKTMRAKELLENAGYYMDAELKIIYGIFGDKKVLAQVNLDTKEIYISEKHIDMDLFPLCTALIEENEHYKTGFEDHTRAFQQHFIDLYTNTMLEKASIDLLN